MGIVVAEGFREDDPNLPPRYRQDPDDADYAAKIREFLDKKSPYEHPLRVREQSKNRRAELFLQSIMWLRLSYNTDPTRTPHWSQRTFDKNDPDSIPMQTYNEVAAYIQNEARS